MNREPRTSWLLGLIMLVAILLVISSCSGCSSIEVTSERFDERAGRVLVTHYEYERWLSDLKVGTFKAARDDDGSVTIEISDLSVEERMTQLARDLALLAQSLAGSAASSAVPAP